MHSTQLDLPAAALNLGSLARHRPLLAATSPRPAIRRLC